MNYRLRLLICISSFVSFACSAFIYEVRILKKWDIERQRYHYFIGLSDFHDKSHSSNATQLKEILAWLTTMPKDKIHLIVEDLSSINQSGALSCGNFFVNSRGGILGGLADTARTMGLSINNVEFRYCRVTSLGPVLNNLTENLEKFPSVAGIQVSALLKEILDNIKEVQTYVVSKGLKRQYELSVANIMQQIKQLEMDAHHNMSMAGYLDKHSTPANRLRLLKKLLTFDSGLLDLKMVHGVNSSADKEKVIAIAGGAHIARSCELLEKDGYKNVQTTKIMFTKEHDLERCLGSHIVDGAFCVKPEPIVLNLDTLLK